VEALCNLTLSTEDLVAALVNPSSLQDWEWKDTAGGDFISCWVGEIVVINYGSEDHWSTMVGE
jgi:hypothetical protein